MMERITFENSQGTKLVGILHPSDTQENIAIIAHGFTSAKDRPRYKLLAETLDERGIAAFRFDFEGCGESENIPITVKAQIDDLHAAIALMRKRGYKNVMLIGHSLGGLISLSCPEDITTMVLWAPVSHAKVPGPFRDEKNIQLLREQGHIIFKRGEREYKLTEEFFDERMTVDQEKLLSKVKCPVLIIHGDEDTSVPLEHSKEAIKLLSKDSELMIVHASHTFDEIIDSIIKITTDWCYRHSRIGQ